MAKQRYVSKVLDLYMQLPETPNRFSRTDLRLAQQLYEEKVTATDIELAMLLATARRFFRRTSAHPLGPIRSLYYFLPVLEELRKHPLPEGYQQYLRQKVQWSLTKNNQFKHAMLDYE